VCLRASAASGKMPFITTASGTVHSQTTGFGFSTSCLEAQVLGMGGCGLTIQRKSTTMECCGMRPNQSLQRTVFGVR
jgi:hypothetical protein